MRVSRHSLEFRVGVIMLLALLVIAGSLFWLQGYKLGQNAQKITVFFEDVGALSVGDDVTVSGVRSGKVDDMTLTAHGVDVLLLMDKNVRLSKDASFSIRNMGVMGERFIAVIPGRDSLPFDYTKTAIGQYDAGLPEVMGKLGEMVMEVRSIVSTLKRTLVSDSSLQKFNNTVENLERVSISLASYMDRNEAKFDRVAEGFAQASLGVNELIAKASNTVETTGVRIDRISDNLETFVMELDTLSQAAKKFAALLDSEEGTAHLLLKDRRLYDDLRRTSGSLDELIADIRANPRKYINLKVEIF